MKPTKVECKTQVAGKECPEAESLSPCGTRVPAPGAVQPSGRAVHREGRHSAGGEDPGTNARSPNEDRPFMQAPPRPEKRFTCRCENSFCAKGTSSEATQRGAADQNFEKITMYSNNDQEAVS